jgi:hypothetical protein
MKRVSYELKLKLDNLPSQIQYDYVRDKCPYYHKIWAINRRLLDSSTVYEDLFGFNNFIDEVR